MQNWNFVSPHKYPSTNVCHYMWTVHQHGSSVITVLFAGSLSLCVLTVRAGGPRFYHVLHTALCHMPSLSSWKLFYFYLFYVVLLFSQFLGQCAHTHLPQQSVFSMNCAQQSAWWLLLCVKFTLSCRSEHLLVLVRVNSWIRRLSPCWNKSF